MNNFFGLSLYISWSRIFFLSLSFRPVLFHVAVAVSDIAVVYFTEFSRIVPTVSLLIDS